MAYRFCELARLGRGEGQRALGLLLAIVFWATPTRGASGAEPAEAFRDARAPSVVDPLVWQEVNHLTGEPNAYDEASYSVAMSGDTVVVAASTNNSVQAGFDTKGKVFVFTRKRAHQPLEPEWQHEATLEPPAGTHTQNYGKAVAISGDTAIVGDGTGSLDLNAPGFGVGAAYVWSRSGTAWSLQQRIQASDPSSGAEPQFLPSPAE